MVCFRNFNNVFEVYIIICMVFRIYGNEDVVKYILICNLYKYIYVK